MLVPAWQRSTPEVVVSANIIPRITTSALEEQDPEAALGEVWEQYGAYRH